MSDPATPSKPFDDEKAPASATQVSEDQMPPSTTEPSKASDDQNKNGDVSGSEPKQNSSNLMYIVDLVIIALFAIGLFKFGPDLRKPEIRRTKAYGNDLFGKPLWGSAALLQSQQNGWLRLSPSLEMLTEREPDVTAILLNWQRLENVVVLVDCLCEPVLNGIIAEVFIWNNNPTPITHQDFADTPCAPEKIKIVNSPTNELFQARYMACAESATPYCYFQDDDYLVLPEIVHTLRERIAESAKSSAIHLLPPHEHLSSTLRRVHNDKTNLHTSFTWLGYGAMVRQSSVIEFLDLFKTLNATDEEMAMADNYFSILKNEIPEIWFDHNMKMPGQRRAFSNGTEGEERNRKHITRAAQYLDSVLTKKSSFFSKGSTHIPYVNTQSSAISPYSEITRTSCTELPCMLETNIKLLPDDLTHKVNSAEDILLVEEANLRVMDEEKRFAYDQNHLAKIVDGMAFHGFHSPFHARKGEYILYDLLTPYGAGDNWTQIQWAFLVERETSEILTASTFEASVDGVNWVGMPYKLNCTGVPPLSTEDRVRLLPFEDSVECAIAFPPAQEIGVRFFKATLKEDRDEHWHIMDIWARGIKVNATESA